MSSSRRRALRFITVPAALLLCLVIAGPALGVNPTTKRVSIGPAGIEGNGNSYSSSISADGRFVAFQSDATNLVANDTNGKPDIFVRDRQTHTTARISVSSAGVEGNGGSYAPSISGNGRYVAFVSDSSNLVANDTNGFLDVYVRDRQAGTTRRVSISSTGHQGNSDSYNPSISADGRYVAFQSDASNLVVHDTNLAGDVFVRDRKTGSTTRISINSSGHQGNGGSYAPSISAEGRYVALQSDATNLIANDTNGAADIFVRDRRAGSTTRVSVSGAGHQGNGGSYTPSISADGRYVAFQSIASNLIAHDTKDSADIFVRDRTAGSTRLVSISSAGHQGNGGSNSPSISADGRYVTFVSDATDLVANDMNGTTDIFVRDRTAGSTRRISISSGGVEGDGASYSPHISADGRFVVFESVATNLVANDLNGTYDVFVRGPIH